MEGPALWPTAAHADDYPLRHDAMQVDSKGKLLPHCFESTSHPEHHILSPHDMRFRSLAS